LAGHIHKTLRSNGTFNALKINRWQREMMVAGSLWISVVASIKLHGQGVLPAFSTKR
jgi:hypothetical protein